jgi:hypothetical protein
MAWEGRKELDDTILVTLLDTSVEGRVKVSVIARVAVSIGDNSRVDTL